MYTERICLWKISMFLKELRIEKMGFVFRFTIFVSSSIIMKIFEMEGRKQWNAKQNPEIL